MTTTINFGDDQIQQLISTNQQQADEIVSKAQSGSVASGQFDFLAVYDGTNNTLQEKWKEVLVRARSSLAMVLTSVAATFVLVMWLTRIRAAITRSICICALTLSAACATSHEVVDHAFEFNARRDSPGVEILDYRYGDSANPGAANPEQFRRSGTAPQQIGIGGPMRRADSLFVKWRIAGTGELHEETVSLRELLPRDLMNHRVYFIVRGSQLYVYLVPPDSRKRGPHTPMDGPSLYRHLDVVLIHPKNSMLRRTQ